MNRKEKYEMSKKADRLEKESGNADTDNIVKLKNDGNVTKQINEAIGHDDLRWYKTEWDLENNKTE
ncbi:hypothetical protein [Anaerovorax odorimutans]|uniref:hypothetical protein n=1 Tax=Anaerovorax odorimutans TaxID=109327 RepID=UPI00040A6A28|nr:hypothetical protein [Anaerovorax odorimutans]